MIRRAAEAVELAGILRQLGTAQRKRRAALLSAAGRGTLVASGTITRFAPAPGVRYSVEVIGDEPELLPAGVVGV